MRSCGLDVVRDCKINLLPKRRPCLDYFTYILTKAKVGPASKELSVIRTERSCKTNSWHSPFQYQYVSDLE